MDYWSSGVIALCLDEISKAIDGWMLSVEKSIGEDIRFTISSVADEVSFSFWR